jgi:hypothetical protein
MLILRHHGTANVSPLASNEQAILRWPSVAGMPLEFSHGLSNGLCGSDQDENFNEVIRQYFQTMRIQETSRQPRQAGEKVRPLSHTNAINYMILTLCARQGAGGGITRQTA